MMHHNRTPKMAFLLGALALGTSAFAHDVTVGVYTGKVRYLLGEPVIVSATVINGSEAPVKLIHHNAPTLKERPLSIVDLRLGATPDQMKRWGDDLRIRMTTPPATLDPHQEFKIDLVMLYNNRENEFFALSPGRYFVTGRIVIDANPFIEILSEPIEIEVLQPSAVVDRTNWEWLKAHKEEYGRMVQVPWEAELSDEFLHEAARRCETSQSVYGEYLGLFLSRAYREGPKKDADLSVHFAEIAKGKASSATLRSEAEEILRSPKVKSPPMPPPPTVARAVDAATQRTVTESLEKFAAALTGGRMDECAALLSEDYLRNGAQDKASALANLEGDLSEHKGVVVSIKVEAVSGGATDDEVEVSGRLVGKTPGRAIEEHPTRWILRREGDSWLILRSDRAAAAPTSP